ncbi:unnamed protein product [Paramecium octaurelia]|uniref:Uncharacterized protein n=1 Tax=Paramecium octaurelia TaxID=43137 RepID=A0A8S1SE82_PAROT|nr:unnamed protein product [Paramecium octaurelia]
MVEHEKYSKMNKLIIKKELDIKNEASQIKKIQRIHAKNRDYLVGQIISFLLRRYLGLQTWNKCRSMQAYYSTSYDIYEVILGSFNYFQTCYF